jgi:thiopurine S-methyltransferase
VSVDTLVVAMDSTDPAFWDVRYRDGVTPWQPDAPQPEALALGPPPRPGARMLVPGCGWTAETLVFAAAGWDVLAVDFSGEAVALARRHLAGSTVEVRQADVFELDEPPFDLVYERAFLCALHPRTRPTYGRRMPELVRPGGLLVGYFEVGDKRGGPPYDIVRDDLDALLQPAFSLEIDRVSKAPMPNFEHERWMAWRRRTA